MFGDVANISEDKYIMTQRKNKITLETKTFHEK